MTSSASLNALQGTIRLGNFTASQEVVGALRNAAAGSGTTFGLLASKAALESGFRPDAQAPTSSARGLFQFTEQTWLSMVQRYGSKYGVGQEAAQIQGGQGARLGVPDAALRTRILAMRDNPELSANFANDYMREVSDGLTPGLGRRPDAAELYLGHFLGVGGASRMLQALATNPSQAASTVLPQAAAANASSFNAPDGTPLTVAQFMERLRGKVNRAYASLGLQPPSGSIDIAGEPAATRTAPGEPGSWGNGTPARMSLHPERVIVANLTRVFAKLGKHGSIAGRQQGVQEIPAAVLGALRESNTPGRDI